MRQTDRFIRIQLRQTGGTIAPANLLPPENRQ